MNNLYQKLLEKQKLRKELLDLGLVCMVQGPQGLKGEKGDKGDKGDPGSTSPATYESIFYTSFNDTKEEGMFIINMPWLIPNPSEHFEIISDTEVLVKEGIYEISLSCQMIGADASHGAQVYLQDENGSEFKALSFTYPQNNGTFSSFYQTTLIRLEKDTTLSVNALIMGDKDSSNIEFSNANLMLKKILFSK